MRSNHSRYYFKLIEKFKRSGLTVKEFCRQHSLNDKVYYYWKKKYEARGSDGFLPVVIDKAPAVNAGTVTIHYPDGTRLVFEGAADTNLIKELLPAFSQ